MMNTPFTLRSLLINFAKASAKSETVLRQAKHEWVISHLFQFLSLNLELVEGSKGFLTASQAVAANSLSPHPVLLPCGEKGPLFICA